MCTPAVHTYRDCQFVERFLLQTEHRRELKDADQPPAIGVYSIELGLHLGIHLYEDGHKRDKLYEESPKRDTLYEESPKRDTLYEERGPKRDALYEEGPRRDTLYEERGPKPNSSGSTQ